MDVRMSPRVEINEKVVTFYKTNAKKVEPGKIQQGKTDGAEREEKPATERKEDEDAKKENRSRQEAVSSRPEVEPEDVEQSKAKGKTKGGKEGKGKKSKTKGGKDDSGKAKGKKGGKQASTARDIRRARASTTTGEDMIGTGTITATETGILQRALLPLPQRQWRLSLLTVRRRPLAETMSFGRQQHET